MNHPAHDPWPGWSDLAEQRKDAKRKRAQEAGDILLTFLLAEAPRLYAGEDVRDMDVDSICALQDKLLQDLDLELRREVITQLRLGLSKGYEAGIWQVPLPDLELSITPPSPLVKPVDFVSRQSFAALIKVVSARMAEISNASPKDHATLLRLAGLAGGGLLTQTDANLLPYLEPAQITRANGILFVHFDRTRFSPAWFVTPLAELILWRAVRSGQLPLISSKTQPRFRQGLESLMDLVEKPDQSTKHVLPGAAKVQLTSNLAGAIRAEASKTASGMLVAHGTGLNRTHPMRRTTLYRLIFNRPLRHDLPVDWQDPPEKPDENDQSSPPLSETLSKRLELVFGPGETLVREVQRKLYDFAELPGLPNTDAMVEHIQAGLAGHPDATPMARALVIWVERSLQTDWNHRQRGSTIYANLNRIWRAVLAVETEGLPAHDDANGWGVFFSSSFLLLATRKTAKKSVSALKAFHAVLIDLKLAPAIKYSEIEGLSARGEAFDPNLVTPTEYREALHRIKAMTNTDPWRVEVCWLVTVLGFRCGLRREEAMFLQVRSIDPGNNPILTIKDTKRQTLKTAAGNRRLPLRALLETDEFDRLIAFVKKRRQEVGTDTDRLLFSEAGGSDMPLTDFTLLRPIQRALRAASGDKRIVFHHLRHSFVNWLLLRLIVSRAPRLIDSRMKVFDDPMFSEESCQKLRADLYCERPGGAIDPGARDAYLVTLLVGHTSPAITLKSYFHFSDWLVSRVTWEKDVLLPTKTVARFLGVHASEVSRLRKKTPEIKSALRMKGISIEALNGYLSRDGEFSDLQPDDVTSSKANAPALKRSVNFDREIAALREARSLLGKSPRDVLGIVKRLTKIHAALPQVVDEAAELLGKPPAMINRWLDRIALIPPNVANWRSYALLTLPEKPGDIGEFDQVVRAVASLDLNARKTVFRQLKNLIPLFSPITGAWTFSWRKSRIVEFSRLINALHIPADRIAVRIQLGRGGKAFEQEASLKLQTQLRIGPAAIRFKYGAASIGELEDAEVEIYVLEEGKQLGSTKRIGHQSLGFRTALTSCFVFQEVFADMKDAAICSTETVKSAQESLTELGPAPIPTNSGKCDNDNAAEADRRPELVIFCGIPGAGKTTRYKVNYAATHFHLSLDEIPSGSRRKEEKLFRAAIDRRDSIVVDNTNLTPDHRLRYIPAAQAAGYRIIGIQFDVSVEEALTRNARRARKIPEAGLRARAKQLVVLRMEEGFDILLPANN